MFRRFWLRLASELNDLVHGERAAGDFVGRFYTLVDERPPGLDPDLTAAFETFHYDVANFEPRPEIRDQELGLLGEEELKRRASVFLQAIEATISSRELGPRDENAEDAAGPGLNNLGS